MGLAMAAAVPFCMSTSRSMPPPRAENKARNTKPTKSKFRCLAMAPPMMPLSTTPMRSKV